MSSHIPIILKGNNLGERHRYLNMLVCEAYTLQEPLETLLTLPESSPLDRLFKIELASKHKHIEYILKNLQDDDMLYVTKALKSKWLLDKDYWDIINPSNLENVLYPKMLTTAVNKMKHWIHLNLKCPERCQEFYEHYFDKDFDVAIKFLTKTRTDFIANEIEKEKVVDKITPHYFKLLCERTPLVAPIFFKKIKENQSILRDYLKKEHKYFESLKFTLKSDADIFLDIVENHFPLKLKRMSPIATKFIIKQRKKRFLLKPELYTCSLLNVHTLAQFLSREECEQLVMRLARAEYLSDWFNYKNVEPLLKRLNSDKRVELKKKIFVDGDIGEKIKECPYPYPVPVRVKNDSVDFDVFCDYKMETSAEYEWFGQSPRGNYLSRPMGACYYATPNCALVRGVLEKPKSVLDKMFDEYRFKSFDRSLFELRKKISAESSSRNRMYMLLVLVSKSGGRLESVEALFQLLMHHLNEPPQVRAAIVRSLVKRASVWRLPENTWNNLLIFGRGLGLDGNSPDAECREGLHAVVIRHLLSNEQCVSAVKMAFGKNFSTLTEYSLTAAEKQHISTALLYTILETAETQDKTDVAAQILQYALDTLEAYKLKLDSFPEVIASIKNLVRKDKDSVQDLLKRLYYSRRGRKELFHENFNLLETDASFTNALKHDPTVLLVDTFLEAILYRELQAERFLRKLSIYFCENLGLAYRFLNAIKEAKADKKLARPLVYLVGNDLKACILLYDSKTGEEFKKMSAEIRANAHIAKPSSCIDSWEWQKAGAKLIANRVLICRRDDLDRLIKQLLTWKRTAKLAILLAQRTSYVADIFEAVVKITPTITLKTALTYIRRQKGQSDPRIWEIIKPLIIKLKDSLKRNPRLLHDLRKVDSIPTSIRPEYATVVFMVTSEIDFKLSISVLFHINLLLPNIDENFIETILYDFLQNQFIIKKMSEDYIDIKIATLFLRILIKYLLLCKTEDIQTRRFEKIGQLYLDRLQACWRSTGKKTFLKFLTAMSFAFKNTEIFMNKEYVSCLPVMEKFIKWMHAIMPMEEYFRYYVPIHLNMLYFKAIRQTVTLMPEMLADQQSRRNEGTKIVGELFGKYLGHEAQELRKRYYDSIIELYGKHLVAYITVYWNTDGYRIVPSIIQGILAVASGIECVLALNLWDHINYAYNDEENAQICNNMRQNDAIEMQFFISANPKVKISGIM